MDDHEYTSSAILLSDYAKQLRGNGTEKYVEKLTIKVVFKKLWNIIIPDNSSFIGSRKRRWEGEDDGSNTPGLPHYSYKMPKRSKSYSSTGPATSTPLSRQWKSSSKETSHQTEDKQVRTVFVKKIAAKKENMTDNDVVVLASTSRQEKYVSTESPLRMPLVSKQQDDVIVEYDSTSRMQQPTTSTAPSVPPPADASTSPLYIVNDTIVSSWLKPKSRPPQRFCLPNSSLSRSFKHKKMKNFTDIKSTFVRDSKNSSLTSSTLRDCYQLDEKKKYSDTLKNFLTDTNIATLLSRKIQKQKSPWPKKDVIELVDLTLTEENTDIGKTISELPVIRAEERIPVTKVMAKKDVSDDEVVILEDVPYKNTLAQSLEKRVLFKDTWISEMLNAYKERQKILEKEKQKEMECLKLIEQKVKEEYDEKYLDRILKRIKLLEITKEEEIEEIEEEEEEEFPQLSEAAEDNSRASTALSSKRRDGSCENLQQIDKAFFPASATEVLVSGFNRNITRHDISTLKRLQWLNDEIINFYMDLLTERGKLDNYPSVYAFNTFFFPKIMAGGHATVKRWTKKVDIFSHEILLMPVHLGMHWCMIIIDLPKKTITYYDSMGGPDRGALGKILKYLIDEAMDKKKEVLDISDWQLITAKDIPQQMNGSDCGMFSCMFAEVVSRRKKINFTQEHMPYFRRRMVYEILTKQLLT